MKLSPFVAAALLAGLASTAAARTYWDVPAGPNQGPINLNPYFGTGYNPDVGNQTKNTSLLAPWVTIKGVGDGNFDSFIFTLATPGWIYIDIDYTAGYAKGFDSALRLYDVTPYQNIQRGYSDDSQTSEGAGGSISGQDAYMQYHARENRTYMVRVQRTASAASVVIPFGATYTLNIQAPVNVIPVPEPTTGAMLLAGLALIGAVAHRRGRG